MNPPFTLEQFLNVFRDYNVWSVIGFTAAFKFGIWEDTGLLVAGIISGVLLLPPKRRK